jgi:hypothetical protein
MSQAFLDTVFRETVEDVIAGLIVAAIIGLIRGRVWASQAVASAQSDIGIAGVIVPPRTPWMKIFFVGAFAIIWGGALLTGATGLALYCVGGQPYISNYLGYVLLVVLVGFVLVQIPRIVRYARLGRAGGYALRLFTEPYVWFFVTMALFRGYQKLLGVPHTPDLGSGCFRNALSGLFTLGWILPGAVVFFTPYVRLIPRFKTKRR